MPQMSKAAAADLAQAGYEAAEAQAGTADPVPRLHSMLVQLCIWE